MRFILNVNQYFNFGKIFEEAITPSPYLSTGYDFCRKNIYKIGCSEQYNKF
jgi:hypothetical protein